MNFNRLRKFFRKQYRDVFGTSITGTTSAQIRAMREKEVWSQEELAVKAKMGQARISLLENPNYQNLSLNTLKRIANVFDVALIVRFVPFSELFATIDGETAQTLAPLSFAKEFGSSKPKVIDLLTATEARLAALYQVKNQSASGSMESARLGNDSPQQGASAASSEIQASVVKAGSQDELRWKSPSSQSDVARAS